MPMLKSLAWAATAAALLLAPHAPKAHELEANRLMLVMRDPQHISLTFYLQLSDVLHKSQAPHLPLSQFLVTYSAMEPKAFQHAWGLTVDHLQRQTQLVTAKGQVVPLTQWVWPNAVKVQNSLRERTMQAMVAPNEHSHEAVQEIQVQATSAENLRRVRVRLAPSLHPILVVSYKPEQTWIQATTPSAEIQFGASAWQAGQASDKPVRAK